VQSASNNPSKHFFSSFPLKAENIITCNIIVAKRLKNPKGKINNSLPNSVPFVPNFIAKPYNSDGCITFK